MTDARIPDTGEVEVVERDEAAEIIEHVAHDSADPELTTLPLLIVLDIDGTILLEDESLSPGIVEAVADARAAGNEVMLATGRSWEGTEASCACSNSTPNMSCARTERSFCSVVTPDRCTTSASTPRRSTRPRC